MKNEKELTNYVNLCVNREMGELFNWTRDLLVRAKSSYGVDAIGYHMPAYEDDVYADEFYYCCKACDIKPIIGSLYFFSKERGAKFADERLIYLLAVNSEGYGNLLRIRRILKEAQIDYTTLNECREGLLCVYRVNGYHPETEEKVFSAIKNIFNENLYVCCQSPEYVEYMRNFATTHNVKAVVFDHARYIDEQDYKEYVEFLDKGSKSIEGREGSVMETITDDYYLKTYSDMIKKYPTAGDFIKNTVEIAEKCNVELNAEDIF